MIKRIVTRQPLKYPRNSTTGRALVMMAAASIAFTQPLSQSAQAQAQAPAGSANDQQIPAGVAILNTTNYRPIAPGSSFDTMVEDPVNPEGSALEATILDRVNKELVMRGYHVDRNAPFVMLVGGDLVRGTSKDAATDKIKGVVGKQNECKGNIFSANGNTLSAQTSPGPHANECQGNIFSTNGNTLLTRTLPDPRPNTFRIRLSIYDRKTGLYLWRGSIDRGTSNLTPDQATDRMVPPLVGSIGRGKQDQKVNIGIAE